MKLKGHSDGNARRFRDLVRLTPGILEAHAVTGDFDYLLKVCVPISMACANSSMACCCSTNQSIGCARKSCSRSCATIRCWRLILELLSVISTVREKLPAGSCKAIL